LHPPLWFIMSHKLKLGSLKLIITPIENIREWNVKL
jgi:hypothetical protein